MKKLIIMALFSMGIGAQSLRICVKSYQIDNPTFALPSGDALFSWVVPQNNVTWQGGCSSPQGKFAVPFYFSGNYGWTGPEFIHGHVLKGITQNKAVDLWISQSLCINGLPVIMNAKVDEFASC